MSKTRRFREVTSEPGRPLYDAVGEVVREAIDSGRIEQGDRLPSTRELSVELGVSLVTVHRALQDLVGRGVLRRGQGRGTFVHEDYHNPNRKASEMRFGVVFHDESSIADSYHGRLLEGVRRGGLELGVDLVLLRYGEDWRKECDGFIYVNPFMSQLERSPRQWSSDARSDQFPNSVVVGARTDRPDVSVVDTDNVGIGQDAVAHLASRGHQRIMLIGGERDFSNNADRIEGFYRGCEQAKIDPGSVPVLLRPDWRTDAEGESKLRELLGREDRPTGVFAAGYYFALDVYRVASELGLRIGRDLSVVGVDDPPSAELLSPPLTTVRQPLVQMGRAAVEVLVRRIRAGKSGGAAEHKIFRAELVERESTGPARD